MMMARAIQLGAIVRLMKLIFDEIRIEIASESHYWLTEEAKKHKRNEEWRMKISLTVDWAKEQDIKTLWIRIDNNDDCGQEIVVLIGMRDCAW